MKQGIYYLCIFLLPLFLIGIQIGLVHSNILIVCMGIYCFSLSRKEIAVAMSLVLNGTFGLFFSNISLGIPGSLVAFFITILLLNKDLIKLISGNTHKSFNYIIAIVVICFVFLLLGGSTSQGTTKMAKMLITIAYSGISILCISKFSDISSEKLAPLFILSGAYSMAFFYDFYTLINPTGIFDFGVFREATMMNLHSDLPYVSYHMTGIAGSTSLAFFLSRKNSVNTVSDLILIFSALLLILYSGARQTIFAAFLILSMWYMMRKEHVSFIQIVLLLLFIWLGYELLLIMNIPYLKSVLESNGNLSETVNRNYDYPIMLITQNPIIGIGFGNYFNPITEEYYPHNLILEILCEMGFLGLFLFILVIVFYFINNKVSLYNRLPNNSLSVILILPFFVRSLISDDLTGNIMLFITLFIFLNTKDKVIE